MIPLQFQLDGVIGSNPILGPVGILIGVLGVALLIYWMLEAITAERVEGPEEIAEEVSGSAVDFVLAVVAVMITIGDQVIGLFGDLVGMIDSPVILGHVAGGILGFLGLEGTISQQTFLLAFAAVTVVALVWRSSMSRGRGL